MTSRERGAKPLKVLMLTFSGHDYVHELAMELGNLCDLTVVWPKAEEVPAYDTGMPYKVIELDRRPSTLLHSMDWIREVNRIVGEVKPDLIHTQIPNAGVSAALKLTRVPVVSTVHNPVALHATGLATRVRQWLLMKSPDWYVVHGKWSRKVLAGENAISPSKIAMHEHGPISSYGSVEEYEPSTGNSILFFGNIMPYKGLEWLLKAAERMTPAPHVIIAGGADPAYIARCLDETTVRPEVHLGLVDRQTVTELFSRSACVCLPYVMASQSGVLGIAKGFGRASVVTQTGDLADGVDAPCYGLAVPPHDADALADALTRILEDDNLRHTMELNTQRYVRSRPWRHAACELETQYRRWLNS